ncbi:uncharacterized protein B0H18DRAFT_955336 [Fomitopsis serialis]|uniref:uncharacterized protein n=1 Tax=Fomitopsis serialis TaxID=139415 RepID=UPI0020082E5D|nr:uncharacterized protein B0H18DRAFT_955336 [Neoantrodia serialis]KAH9924717.1 hypothetical protein B0H18DRAFT_955336 [Neoantrodia serialis]
MAIQRFWYASTPFLRALVLMNYMPRSRTFSLTQGPLGYYTTPQKNLANRQIQMIRGKMLGGCSGLNNLGIILAGSVEYDAIDQLGNPGWSYNTTLQYFKKATNMSEAPEALQITTHATEDPTYHGTDGPVRASYSAWYSDATPLAYDAMVNLGFSQAYDGAYYAPNAARPNLLVVTGAQVTKIVTSQAGSSGNLTATGITFVSGSQTYTANASREVILSAGSVQTPQLLELSGIGNKTLLESLGIESKLDLPEVGENYQDHLIAYEQFILPSDVVTWDVFSNPGPNATAWLEYETNRTGPYASSINVISYQPAAKVVGNNTLLEQWLAELDEQFNATQPTAGHRAMYDRGPGFQLNTSYLMLASIPSHPFSRGSIHIDTSYPLAKPIIDMNALALDIDKHLFVAGAKFIRTIAQTSPLSDEIQSMDLPALNMTTDDDWEKFIAENVDNPAHPCCTAAMLPRELGGVVDSTLTVYGTSNLRVVDLSILPLGTAYAIAEQAADLIKADYGF